MIKTAVATADNDPIRRSRLAWVAEVLQRPVVLGKQGFEAAQRLSGRKNGPR